VARRARDSRVSPHIAPDAPSADPADFTEWVIDEPFDGGRIENPVPRDAAPREAEAGDGSLDIKTGQRAAQKLLDAGRV